MKKGILFTRPNYDQATKCLHYISNNAVKELEKVGEYQILKLDAEKATRSEFEKILKKRKPNLIILHGHGSKEDVTGHNNEVILDKDNIDLLSEKIIVAVACDSLSGLGEYAVTTGSAKAYIGYKARFMVITDPAASAALHRDKNLTPFIQVYSMLISALAAGLTVGDAIEKTKELTRSLIREYGVYGIRDAYGDAPLIRWALYWDLFFLNGLGDLESCV
ncbi:MAG: hypothetical protein ACE5FT_00035 [Candidatus Nanoarchaeia archaeon]